MMRALAALTLMPALAAAQAELDPANLSPPPPLEFDIPAVERIELPNGMILFFLEDHELPLVEVQTLTRTGSVYEPADKAGLAGITATVMRTGGIEGMTGDALDAELDFQASAIEIGMGEESCSASLSCLTENLPRGLELLAAVLRTPQFAQEKIDLAINAERESVRRANDDPMGIARREFRSLIYGRGNPWARVTTGATLDAITRDDLVAFHQRFFHPNSTMIAVAGDVSREALLALLDEHFGDWPQAELDIPPLPEVPDSITPGIFFIHRPDVNQSNVRLGHFGVSRHDPDEYVIRVMNFLYGSSGFTSRLVREARTNRGLTYGISGQITEHTVRGLYVVATFTKSETTREMIDVIRQVTRDFQASPPAEAELELAKTSEMNSFVFRFETPISIASQRMNYEYHGYPADYLETYLDNIRAVTAEDVQRVAQERMHVDQAAILVVGNADEIGDQLTQLGEVTEVPLMDFATGEQIWP